MADDIGEVCHMFYVSIQFKNGIVVVFYIIDKCDDDDSVAKKEDCWRLPLIPHLISRFGCFIRVMIGLIRVLLTLLRTDRCTVQCSLLYTYNVLRRSELRFQMAKKIPELDITG